MSKAANLKSSRMRTAFERKLSELDLSLFSAIGSQTSELDRKALLALQAAVREKRGGYCYLEIGSYLGGTLQPHLMDSECRQIYSIDSRVDSQPDNRGKRYSYQGISAEQMMAKLREIDAEAAEKVTTFESDASKIDHSRFKVRPDFCFIDGEHTDTAVTADFDFCLSVIQGNGVIAFHDAGIVPNAISQIVRKLESLGKPFHAYLLAGEIFVIELGKVDHHQHPAVVSLLAHNAATALPLLTSYFELNQRKDSFAAKLKSKLIRFFRDF